MTRTRLVLLLLTCSVAALGTPITGLVSTGLGPAVSPDPDWSLAGGTAYRTQTGVFPLNGPWLPDDALSGWISPRPSYGGATDAPGTYAYSLTFDLTGYQPGTATFAYRLAADNAITSVTLNGVSIPGSGFAGFSSLSGLYTVPAGSAVFLPGVNTLTVTTQNYAGATGNPNGLRFLVVSSDVQETPEAVPEPATAALAATALAALGLWRKK